METSDLRVQCFVKREAKVFFDKKNDPRLLYVSEIRPSASDHPRVMHAHEDFVEIVLICDGSSQYLVHDKQYNVEAGDLLIYNAGVVHDEISGPDNRVGLYALAVSGLNMPGLQPNMLIPEDAAYIYHTGEYFQELRSMCRMMFRNLSETTPNAEAFCNILLHAVLVRVLSVVQGHVDAEPEQPEELENVQVLGTLIKKYIDRHYKEEITLQSISENLHISQYYMAHVFKEMSGYSPMQYILRRRIGEAQTLLITTDYSITRIAEMVGYDSQSYFNYQFSKHVGVSPNKYRKNYLVENEVGESTEEKKKAGRQSGRGRTKGS